MTRNATLLMALSCAVAALAQNDSLAVPEKKHKLQEVVVEADVAMTSAEKSTYLPTRRQRNAAADATSLLQQMMIPQLSIDPMAGKVRTVANEDVAVFIDFMPASKEDLEGMNTQDVKRVEVYENPKDVRFLNRQHVVNFVMQRYEAGGYTKLTTTENVFADFSATNSVYSKLAYKKVTFDVNATSIFTDTKHLGTLSEAVFGFPSQTVVRTESAEDGEYRKHSPSASLRAICNTGKVQLANRLEILYENTPRNNLSGTVCYSPTLLCPAVSDSRNSSSSLTPKYQGNWYFELPKDWGLSVNPEFMYMRNKVNRFYQEGVGQPIRHEIKERMGYLMWQALLSKTFAGRHTVSVIHYGDNYGSAMDYTGSTVSDSDVRMFNIGQGARYSFTMPGFSLSTYFVYCYSHNRMGGVTQKRWFPAGNITASYSPDRKNSLNLQFVLVNQSADGSKRNPNVLKENELMYYSGNPDVDDYSTGVVALQHTWMPTGAFTMTSFVQDYFGKNYYANVWTLRDDGFSLLRRVENVGDINTVSFGTSMTLRLFNNSLQINAYPYWSICHTSGAYGNSKPAFLFVSSATWYTGQFNLQAYLRTSERSYDSMNNAWKTARPQFQFAAGWGNAAWKVKVTVANPFRSHWRDSQTEIVSPLFSSEKQSYNASSHQRLNISLTYIFNYGKKVQHGDELKAATGGQSSIL